VDADTVLEAKVLVAEEAGRAEEVKFRTGAEDADGPPTVTVTVDISELSVTVLVTAT